MARIALAFISTSVAAALAFISTSVAAVLASWSFAVDATRGSRRRAVAASSNLHLILMLVVALVRATMLKCLSTPSGARARGAVSVIKLEAKLKRNRSEEHKELSEKKELTNGFDCVGNHLVLICD